MENKEEAKAFIDECETFINDCEEALEDCVGSLARIADEHNVVETVLVDTFCDSLKEHFGCSVGYDVGDAAYKVVVIAFEYGDQYIISYKGTTEPETIEDAFASYIDSKGEDIEEESAVDIIDTVMQSFVIDGELTYRWVPFYHIAI